MSIDLSTFSSDELQNALSSEIFRSMLDAMPISIAFLMPIRNADGEISGFKYSHMNKAAGQSDQDNGKTISRNHNMFEMMHRVAKNGTPGEFTYNFPGETMKQLHYTARKFHDGIVLSAADITDNKMAEQKIISLNKSLKSKNRELLSLNKELKTFTSIAAFDYKDTLKTLYTNLEYIISNDAKNFSNTGKANLRKAQTAIQKMKLLTDDIVAFSRIQAIDDIQSAVDLNKSVNDAIRELDEKIAEAKVVIEKEELPVVSAFPFLIDLLFFHLLDNAIKFRDPEKIPEIKVHYHVTKERNTDHDMHQITFIDNGMGFAQEESEKVFEMFYRIHDKKYKGSGIGLAICRKIMTLHGGTIAVESEPGRGTAICCFFPFS